jgi:Golgi apparatus protein 1
VVRVARGAASDIRLNIRLFKACAADWKRFCDDVEPGHMRVQECLEDHIEDSGFSHGCRTALKDVIAARVADFRCARARVCVCGGGGCCGVLCYVGRSDGWLGACQCDAALQATGA